MSRIRADKFVNNDATRAPELSLGAEVPVGYGITGAGGINIAGVATAASFSGSATGLTGTPDITVRNITGVGATFSGTVNYEDVTNIDSVGIVTARAGVRVPAGGLDVTGVTTSSETRLQSVSEDIQVGVGTSVTINFANGDGNIGIVTAANGPIELYVTNVPVGAGFSSKAISFTVVAIQTATAYACTSVYFNGTSQTLRYNGGTVSIGNTSGIDYFNFVGIDTIGNGALSSYTVTTNVNGDYRFY